MDDLPRIATLDGRTACREALRAAVDEAATADARELLLSDADYADWPLGERELVERLGAWIGARRRLTVLAARYDDLAQRHPRWVAFRRQWSHVVDCHAAADAEAADLPSMLLVPGQVVVRIVDRRHGRGVVSREPADLTAARELYEAHLQQSVPAFPATTLGL